MNQTFLRAIPPSVLPSRARRGLLTAALAAAALLLPAGPAPATFFPADTIAGPSGDITALGGVDIGRDGGGGLVYLQKSDNGQPHVFLSVFGEGQFEPPVRVDGGQEGPSSQPVIAAGEKGRLAIVWVNNGMLWGSVIIEGGAGLAGPTPLAPGTPSSPVINPAIDMSVNGAAYAVYAAPGASASDVHATRLAPGGADWNGIPGVLDAAASRDAGLGEDGRPNVGVSADGTAAAVWGEAGAVYMRRVGRNQASSVTPEVNVAELEGARGGAAGQPDVALQNDSSFGYVVARQIFDEGGGQVAARTFSRRIVGSNLEQPIPIDGMTVPAPEGAGRPHIALDGRGRGLSTSSREGSLSPIIDIVRDGAFAGGQGVGGGAGVSPFTDAAVGQNITALVSWQLDAGGGHTVVNALAIEKDRFTEPFQVSRDEWGPVNVPAPTPPPTRTTPTPTATSPLPTVSIPLITPPATTTTPTTSTSTTPTTPAGPPNVPAAIGGPDVAADRVGDAVVAFLQGGPGDRRVVAGYFDNPPTRARQITKRAVRTARPKLQWDKPFEPWGAPTYNVYVDGRKIGETQQQAITVRRGLRAGKHRWRVSVTDIRGQSVPGKDRTIYVCTQGSSKRARACLRKAR